jgi:hypothetical protein
MGANMKLLNFFASVVLTLGIIIGGLLFHHSVIDVIVTILFVILIGGAMLYNRKLYKAIYPDCEWYEWWFGVPSRFRPPPMP